MSTPRAHSPRTGPSTDPRPRRRVAIAAALGVLAAIAVPAASPAFAHDTLSSADPAAGATVAAPLETVSLTFSEDLLALGAGANGFAIQVLAADGSHLADGCVEVAGPTAETRVALPEDGDYAVRWQVVSSDGHPISGEYSFSYAAGETNEVRTVTEPPACGDPWAGSEPEPEMTTMTEAPVESAEPAEPLPASPAPAVGDDGEQEPTGSDSEEADIPLGVLVIGSLGILAVGALVILVARRRTRDLP